MSVNVVEREDTKVVETMAMPPPAETSVPETPMFRGLHELRAGKRLGAHGRERWFHILAAVAGTGIVLGTLYAAMMFLE